MDPCIISKGSSTLHSLALLSVLYCSDLYLLLHPLHHLSGRTLYRRHILHLAEGMQSLSPKMKYQYVQGHGQGNGHGHAQVSPIVALPPPVATAPRGASPVEVETRNMNNGRRVSENDFALLACGPGGPRGMRNSVVEAGGRSHRVLEMGVGEEEWKRDSGKDWGEEVVGVGGPPNDGGYDVNGSRHLGDRVESFAGPVPDTLGDVVREERMGDGLVGGVRGIGVVGRMEGNR